MSILVLFKITREWIHSVVDMHNDRMEVRCYKSLFYVRSFSMNTSFSLTDICVKDTEAEEKGQQDNVQMVVDSSGDLEDEKDDIKIENLPSKQTINRS